MVTRTGTSSPREFPSTRPRRPIKTRNGAVSASSHDIRELALGGRRDWSTRLLTTMSLMRGDMWVYT
jgi:hypothetical protein